MIGDEPLVDGEIGYAAQPDLARAPGLRRRPLDRVVEIDRFRERPRLALAGGLAAAAPVDPHRGVALRHPPLRVVVSQFISGFGLSSRLPGGTHSLSF